MNCFIITGEQSELVPLALSFLLQLQSFSTASADLYFSFPSDSHAFLLVNVCGSWKAGRETAAMLTWIGGLVLLFHWSIELLSVKPKILAGLNVG